LSKRTTEDILQSTRSTLKAAELGLADMMKADTGRKIVGLRNLVVFGRMVTFILQNLRTTESAFDEWYAKYQAEMQNDDLLKFFRELRNKIEKEGGIPTSTTADIHHFSRDDLPRFPRPPNAQSFFIGDYFGGSGWEVKLPDGSTEKYYVNLPSEIGSIMVNFRDPPKRHLGYLTEGAAMEYLCKAYIDYLRNLVSDAYKQFSKKSA
jgi:hypothetical protein